MSGSAPRQTVNTRGIGVTVGVGAGVFVAADFLGAWVPASSVYDSTFWVVGGELLKIEQLVISIKLASAIDTMKLIRHFWHRDIVLGLVSPW